MNQLFTSTCASVLAAGLLLGGGTAMAESHMEDAKGGSDMKVEHIDAKRSMDSLTEAVETLREASVMLVNQKEPGAKRQKAFEKAQEALILTQRAMLQLPPSLRIAETEKRKAKDWQTVTATLDEATQELEAAVKAVQKQSAGKGREDAVKTMNDALAEVNAAIAAIPERTPGER